jgi:dTDP-4-dehydrorhamnose reductase
MKVLIIGKGGMLGDDLARKFDGIFDVSIVGRPRVDLLRPETMRAVIDDEAPDVVINCAAMTNVDECELKPDLADKINGRGPGNLARICADTGTKLVHISTDYVFAGREGAPYTEEEEPSPISAYSRSKLLGEELVRKHLDDHLIVRVAWVFGFKEKSFVRFILRSAEDNNEVPVIHEQVGSVTYTMDIGEGTRMLLEHRCSGTYHLTNEGECTRYDFAEEIFRLRGLDPAKLKPVTSADLGWIAPRPQRLLISKEKIKRDTGYVPPNWKEALKEYLRKENNG